MAEGAPELSEGVFPIPITFLIGVRRSTAESVPIDEAEKTAEKALSGGAARSVESAGPSANTINQPQTHTDQIKTIAWNCGSIAC